MSAARMGIWPRIARSIVRALLGLLFRCRLEGSLPERGPYIIVANHQGWADAFLLIALFPAEPRLYFVGDRAGTMTVWWKRAVLESLGVVVPIDRQARSDRGAIESSLRLLQSGAVLGLFPEGRVSHAEAQLAPFRRGVGYLALKARVPVVPIWLRGTAELYLGRELVVTVGRPRVPPDVEPTRAATEAFATVLHDDLAAIAAPWREPAGVTKRLRWLTNIL